MSRCNLCPRKCNAFRTDTENHEGFCGMPALPRIAKACLHYWEEPCISGANGSGAIFFSGCTLRCEFCQNFDVSHKGLGKTISYGRLAEIFSELEQQRANNINLVTPTHYYSAIKKAADIYRPKIPFIYNTSGYDSAEIMDNDLIDIYLFDLKYCDDEKARKYSYAPDYFSVATSAIKAAYSKKSKCIYDKNGIMQEGIIIRHLLLPSATNDAIRIIDWAVENCPGAVFSLMSQYLPFGNAGKYKELSRRVTEREYNKVAEHLFYKSFDNVYVQERSSSDCKYIPDFDLGGV